jgi:hypothetical protein
MIGVVEVTLAADSSVIVTIKTCKTVQNILRNDLPVIRRNQKIMTEDYAEYHQERREKVSRETQNQVINPGQLQRWCEHRLIRFSFPSSA